MALHTRRRVLQGALALLGGLAGCNEVSDGPSGPDDSPTEPGRRLSNTASDPDRVAFRTSDDGDGPLAWFADDPDGTRTTVDRWAGSRSGLIADERTAATLSVADVDGVTDLGSASGATTDSADVFVENAAAVRRFVAETEFDRETIHLEHRRVGECHRLALCHVTWSDQEIETRYGRFLRGHDVACDEEATDRRLTVVRVPAALDPDVVRPGATGVSHGSCFAPPGERGRPTPTADTGTDNSAAGADDTTAEPARTATGSAADVTAEGDG